MAEICPKCNQAMDAETHKKLHDEDSEDHADALKRLLENDTTNKIEDIKEKIINPLEE
jgi:hypothetical protein